MNIIIKLFLLIYLFFFKNHDKIYLMEYKIEEITLDEKGLVCYTLNIERERKKAIEELLEENFFKPKSKDIKPPFKLHITKDSTRFIFNIANISNYRYELCIRLYYSSLKNYINDYFNVCDNYFQGLRTLPQDRIEALDMARRATHNEASKKLQDELDDYIEISDETAKKLFTLICVLSIRK